MKITYVKKILANGEPCGKCADVTARLTDSGYMDRIDEVVIADERDESSPGMRLASEHQVTRAPFFVVEDEGETRVYTVYFKFVNEIFGKATSTTQKAGEILRDNPDLDYI